MATTEQEIFDRLISSLKAAAEACDKLAAHPKTGMNYSRLRRHLQLIEGSARQAAHWREDARFLTVGMNAAYCHQRAGDWLRSHAPRVYFTKLAAALRQLHASTERLRTQPTGRTGAILPHPLHASPASRSSVGWTPSAGGFIMPAGNA